MALMLLTMLAISKIMACPITAGSDGGGESCCRKSQHPPTSCPRTTVRDCPYFILENGKTPNTAPPIVTFTFHPTSTDNAVSPNVSILPVESRLPNSADLFLRICVLRV